MFQNSPARLLIPEQVLVDAKLSNMLRRIVWIEIIDTDFDVVSVSSHDMAILD